MSIKKQWPLLALILLFAVSVGIRWGAFFAQPVVTYAATKDRFTNSEVYKHTGYVFEVYSTLEFREHKYLGYVGKSENFLQRKGIPGLYVYTSFPPTLFVAPFVAFQLVGAGVNLVSLDVFNLVLQLATAILLFYLILQILPRGGRGRTLIAVLGASAYIFATGTMHYHLNVYWAHQLLQPFFVGGLLFFARRQGLFRWWEAALVGAVLSVITWSGLFVVVGMGLYALWKLVRTKNKAYLRMLLGLGGGAVAAIGLVVAHAMIGTGADLGRYFTTVLHRVESRTAASVHYQPVWLIQHFIGWLIEDYGAYILLGYSMALAYIRRFKPTFAWAVVLIAAFPCLESFILIEHDTIYGFGRLKWFIPIILIAALASYEFVKTAKRPKRQYVLIGLFGAAAVLHVAWYLYLYGGTFWK